MDQGKSNVKRFCKAKGITYTWLAGQLGISESYFQHIEAGRRPAPDWYYDRVARVLQVPIENILPAEQPAEVGA